VSGLEEKEAATRSDGLTYYFFGGFGGGVLILYVGD
jgi:hypothetical protein